MSTLKPSSSAQFEMTAGTPPSTGLWRRWTLVLLATLALIVGGLAASATPPGVAQTPSPGLVQASSSGAEHTQAALEVSTTSAVAASAPSAVRATGIYYYYPVVLTSVCQRQGHLSAFWWWYWNPYSVYCYDIDVSAVPTWRYGGGLDINGWCMATYPGSHSVLAGNTVFSWQCVRQG